MGRRKRSPIELPYHPLRAKASKWLHDNKNVAFNNPILTEAIGLNPESRSDTQAVYQTVICSWRKHFIDLYKKWKKAGLLDGKNPNDAWDIMTYNFNQNDAYIFLYDRETGYYKQPDFSEIETMDRGRLEKQWKGIGTVIDEMMVCNAQLILSDGTRKPITDLLKAGTKVDRLLDRHEEGKDV